jgi:hypothetical protein
MSSLPNPELGLSQGIKPQIEQNTPVEGRFLQSRDHHNAAAGQLRNTLQALRYRIEIMI